jgi:cardiolipin synthase
VASSPVPQEHDDSVVSTDRLVTVPNVLTVARLILVGVFAWLVLGPGAQLWAAGALIIAAVTDYLDGFIARRWHQVSRIGQILDPLVDRVTVLTVLIVLGASGILPWWLVLLIIGRDLVLLALLPALRSRGLLALPVHYLGKVATFFLFASFPLLLIGTGGFAWQNLADVIGWALLIWGVGLYWYGAILYIEQAIRVLRAVPPLRASSV